MSIEPLLKTPERSLIFVLDFSGRMNNPVPDSGQPFLDVALQAMGRVLELSVDDGGQEYALVTLGGKKGVELAVPFTCDPTEISERAENLVASGATPLGDQIIIGP